jgi:hypothetical protein
MSGEHAYLAPSSAPVWGHCSGSVLAQQNAPTYDTPEQAAGTAAHWVCSESLSKGLSPGGFVGQTAPNGVVVTSEMAECAGVFVADVLAVCQEHGALQSLRVEHRVHMPQIHEQNWGTLDAALYLPKWRLLYLWDYKHGHRECVAEGNLQLIDYVAGLVSAHKLNGFDEQQIDCVLRIVQPRCYRGPGPVVEWRVKLSDLRGYWNQLEHAAKQAVDNPRLTTGKHCRDCTAVGSCPAARKAAYSLIDYIDQPYAMDTMSGPNLALEWRMLDQGLTAAKARLEALDAEVRHRVSQGDSTLGLALQSTEGRSEWMIPPAQAVALAKQFGVDASKPAVLTPVQTIAAASAAIRPALKQVVDTVTRRPPGTPKLIPAENSKLAAAFKKE